MMLIRRGALSLTLSVVFCENEENEPFWVAWQAWAAEGGAAACRDVATARLQGCLSGQSFSVDF